ncbi:hypothetical protein [Salarchaeum sp. JOR-1]|uniref:hypothetical protein n=1 Tax=Salarchaeum sp. JOR-1 TaxID=2599399 RepID=UPI0011985C61|nr:hypothetical protein [Salarchaeum sp. JOR-1]QDX39912.1 hypothetical protein FQU85_03005 [Salarchaeum sp. JOR-1]
MKPAEFGDAVVTSLRDQVGDHLRSVVGYTADTYVFHYVRDDVRERYTGDELDDAVDELRLETLEKHYLNSVFQRRHGDHYSRVVVFSEATELNFVVADGEGLAVAVDTAYFEPEENVVKTVLGTIEEYTD